GQIVDPLPGADVLLVGVVVVPGTGREVHVPLAFAGRGDDSDQQVRPDHLLAAHRPDVGVVLVVVDQRRFERVAGAVGVVGDGVVVGREFVPLPQVGQVAGGVADLVRRRLLAVADVVGVWADRNVKPCGVGKPLGVDLVDVRPGDGLVAVESADVRSEVVDAGHRHFHLNVGLVRESGQSGGDVAGPHGGPVALDAGRSGP